MSNQTSGHWPTQIVLSSAKKILAVTFDDASHFDIPYELLRVESPSAQVQGHSAAQKVFVKNKTDVSVIRAEPVGRYAVRLVFDDGHDSGIFTWEWLYRLGHDQVALMAAYRSATSAT